MINRKTKDVGMPYVYNGKTYYIQHDLFRLNEFNIECNREKIIAEIFNIFEK